jgi:hypothetical protein
MRQDMTISSGRFLRFAWSVPRHDKRILGMAARASR